MHAAVGHLGAAAALAWLLLALIIVGGGVAYPGSLAINTTMGLAFSGVAAYLDGKRRALVALLRSTPKTPELHTCVRFEAISATAMLLVGLILLSAAAYHVFGERMPVFG